MAEKTPQNDADNDKEVVIAPDAVDAASRGETPKDAATMPRQSGLSDEELSAPGTDILAPDRSVQPGATVTKPTIEMTPEEAADRVGPPRLQGFSQSNTYVSRSRDIFASSFGRAIGGYTFDSSTVTADSNGDKIVFRGTVLSATAGKKAQPRTASQTACMVLNRTINVRDGDVEVSVVKGGRLNATRIRDGAAGGSAAMGVVLGAQVITDLVTRGIFLDNTDV